MLEVFVAGNPAPKGSRAYKGHRNGRAVLVESSRYAKPWHNVIAASVRASWGNRPQMIGPVLLHLGFVMPRPKSTPKRAPTPWAIKRPDADKLTRLVFDALTTAGVYRDDSQVVDFRATKRIAEIAETPGVLIRIAEPSTDTRPAAKVPQR
jgi:crossover junction endodeoxyribonuclease RusA